MLSCRPDATVTKRLAAMRFRTVVLVPILAWLMFGCAASGASDGIDSHGGSSMTSQPSTTADPIVEPVRADAATRAGVDRSAVEIVQAAAVEWSDGSLGCPEPGMLYTQAIVSGWHVVVRAGGRDFDYRVTGPGQFRLCEHPSQE
jgi:hypothetical protein